MLTQKQLLLRSSGIGGSDAAAVCGLSKYKTPLDVYLEKTGLSNKEIEENEYIYWGNALEPVVLARYQQTIESSCIVPEETLRSVSNPFMLANVDAYYVDKNGKRIGVEIKTCSERRSAEFGQEWTDQIPKEYLMQCAHYRIIYDFKYVDLPVLIGGNDFRIYRYYKNEKLEEALIRIEKNFWENHVLKKIPPAPSCAEDVQKLFPKPTSEEVEANEFVIVQIAALKEAKSNIKIWEEKESVAQTAVKSFIAGNSTLVSNGKTLATWKGQSTKRVDVTELKNKNPEIYETFLKDSYFRVLRFSA